ncbi:hypothetical protein CEQ90_03300 [Lewinellaceae bacterium SD302]|nr:hypothetical protein CEQ90_03300 [Lewinellaceae bacterium SD302]
MKLQPGTGIGQITFGLTPEETEDLLGHPDRVGLDEEDEGSLSYQYNHLKLRLTYYDRTDGRLGYIRCAHPELNYRGHRLIGAPVKKAQFVLRKSQKSWHFETYDFFEAYFDEQHWLTLNVEYEQVISVEMGLPFTEDGDYIWP